MGYNSVADITRLSSFV